MSNGFWGNMWISCFFIATFHQIAVYSLCLGRSWILIHLMLKFICTVHRCWAVLRQISKHPMLKFICCELIKNNAFHHFKTSHVKVYQKPARKQSFHCHFKTSHVKVYRFHRQIRHLRKKDFKTSHVKVYRKSEIVQVRLEQFQNIPC